ncbi:hypothetical protein NI456_12730 [Brevundimonas diminuta]|uniref:hypothetical protein n=1 Tax=Brevundimonas diminuta TaxID=293 RepID=UPI00209738C2|nr:hypothetical protein [Brevundimonas diminuta]MCO8019723.1 hypothetical protein [Brevundimonas diminuta]MCO8022998.1 hypothetical protein [Brevundimonas diminuta]
MFSRFGRSREPSPQRLHDERSREADGRAALASEIDAIEAAALVIYVRNGLPGAIGHYQRADRQAPWEKLEDALTPEQRWALVQAAPEGEGRRFASSADLGADSPLPEVRRAAAVLAACRGLRQRLAEAAGFTAQDLADAIQLGAAARRLEDDDAQNLSS